MKKNEPKKTNDLAEMFLAMQELEKTKGIPVDAMLENIKKSIEKACKSNYNNDDVVFAIDINNASTSFNGTREAKWIAAHCAEYGFILRYPKGKEKKTGFMYESWHVRYVGKDLAKKITKSGLCLEEYLGIDSYYH